MPTRFSEANVPAPTFIENRHTGIEPAVTGRKGVPYDWQALLVPADHEFDAAIAALASNDDDSSLASA